jgi:hypothetical protein
MKKFVILTASLCAFCLAAAPITRADDAELVKSAESASPPAVGAGATIYAPRPMAQ